MIIVIYFLGGEEVKKKHEPTKFYVTFVTCFGDMFHKGC